MQPVSLRTARAVLSTPTEDDVDAIYVACQDAAIQRFTTVPSPYEREHALGFVHMVAERWRDDSEYTWAIRASGRLAGMIGLHGVGRGAAEIGYWMAPWARRQGLLVEAAHAVVDWGFADLSPRLERIEWRAVVGNVGSARVARSLGFRYEGTLRQALANAHFRDDGWVAGLLRGDDRTPQPWPVLG
ncbi:GNAT family N-acetyltransferase [Microbacterium hominis]|uniref:GNAT family N-acetyltransferase n=1 Tax=Microbacterium hominis TaxID=162426 RepID=A0A7D4THH3_9MICO|nr:GNAT family N-acetyltransferase [Microbacterium hominis]QKJ20081.1 GNAT family N-acetyltransferase [Microbacterium hominis]